MMIPSLLASVTKADIIEAPFPHLVVKNALPREVFDALSRTFPSEELVIRSEQPKNNALYSYPWRQAREEGKLTPEWQAFVNHHTSQAFFLDIVRLFGDRIDGLYKLSRTYSKPLDQFSIGLRKWGGAHLPENKEADLTMDCQFCMNSPVSAVTRVRGPHVDNSRKLFAGLLYFRQQHDQSTGSDLMFYRYKSGRAPAGVDYDLDDQHVEPVETVCYEANTFVFWLNSLDSIHGVTPRSRTPVTRRFLNMIGELNTHPRGALFDTRRACYV